MHLFTPDPILEEDIFIPRNRDWECEAIGQLLFEYGEKFIESALSHIWEQIVPHIRSGRLAVKDLRVLRDGLAKIAETETYQNYWVPARIPFK